MNKERDLTKKEIKKIYNNGESIMKTKICKCGHEIEIHNHDDATGGCMLKCTCKKFELLIPKKIVDNSNKTKKGCGHKECPECNKLK